MTNREKLSNMSNDEIAKWLEHKLCYDLYDNCYICPLNKAFGNECGAGLCNWLEQEVEDNEEQ